MSAGSGYMSSSTSEREHEGEPYWKLARYGVKLLLNNREQEAATLFRKYPDNLVMFAGYSISVFMDALMTFEDEKLTLANQVLRETEKRCAGTAGWFRVSKTGGRASNADTLSYAEHLEMQIIKADSQLYLATLTFLQQDISGYFKGAWILRKSWKHYMQTYNEILNLYKQIVGELPEEDALKEDCVGNIDIIGSTVEVSSENASGVADANQPHQRETDIQVYSDMELFDKNELLHRDCSSSSLMSQVESTSQTPASAFAPASAANSKLKPVITRNGYLPTNMPKSQTSTFNTTSSQSPTPSTSAAMKKSQSTQSALSKYTQMSFATINSNFQYISSTLNPFNYLGVKAVDIDKETMTRLMCGVSFGYGLLQLGMSLLPPSILRLTNFLGFQGNRSSGLKNLMYARCGTDMRAPMAILALLWYHTIIRPFFALDGNNVQAGVEVASKLIEKAMLEYADSSVFLFFKGRVERLQCEITAAINSFNLSIEKTNHREIKLLSHHEVGWCYLIEHNNRSAVQTFLYLRNQTRWSRSFYSYLTTISAGANGSLLELANLSEYTAVFRSSLKGSQLDDFLARRFKVCPATEEGLISRKPLYWKMFVFELLYLWNSLPCCNTMHITQVINDCVEIRSDPESEPFVGLAHLILGSSYCILKEFTKGVAEFRACLDARKYTSYQADDAYISAFALYELGYLLIREPDTKQEGKQCLQQVHSYKDYDFEQRLSVRIHSVLKHL